MKLTASFRSIFCIATLAASLCAISARGQEVVQNGGFETGDFSHWTVNDPTNFTGLDSDSSFVNSGSWYAYLGASPDPGSLLQTLTTVPGQSYDLSFWLANDTSTGTIDNSFAVFWNGSATPAFAITNMGAVIHVTNPYVQFSVPNLVATGTSTTLEFRYVNNDDFFRFDDVSVTAAVPEPSTVAFAVFGLGILGLSWYGRAKARRA